jgi:2-oxoglutarate ferredoxin oxidoreductase subunit beta
MSDSYRSFLRSAQLPHVWCPGCGNGTIVKSLVEAVDDLAFPKNDVAVISGIGCSGRTTTILDFNTMHTTHGRALAFAAGVKLANPKLHVIVVMGDGDSSAIGGNHLIHACRRNLDLTALIFNNAIYGLTGGQQAPTTPAGKRSTTSTLGSIDHPFDLVKLCLGAGAGFVARTTSFDHQNLASLIRRAIAYPGFAVLDILTACPTYFGRMNDVSEPYDMLSYLRDSTTPLDPFIDAVFDNTSDDTQPDPADLPPLPIGVFRDEIRPEYATLYQTRIAASAQKGRRK